MVSLAGPIRGTPVATPSAGTVPFVADLRGYGDNVAIVTPDGELAYRDLADRVEDAARRLGVGPRLALIAGTNELEPLVFYLAALSAGHPALLVPGGSREVVGSMVAAYDPDVVVSKADAEWVLDERHDGTVHHFHPDLALLLSTSGSTGSPKLVRLSHQNLQANAESIATYLEIRGTDRAATTLPLHYCYGLSVVNSHLLRGASLVLTDLSVVDACFWDLFRDYSCTSFAGVPYTFELLERVDFDRMHLPHLRYLTQAGGRMAPERVRRFATLGRRQGWDLFVMYGQTEATARMAYLPPHLAESHPQAVGVPIPGGSFRLEPVPQHDDHDVGELVYSGPNVMLGYAESPADLQLGRTVDVLRTGDLARRSADGLYEVVGRRSRFVKVFGLRIDLHRVETVLGAGGPTVACVDGDDQLVVAVEDARQAAALQRHAAHECGLPVHAVRVLPVGPLPRLSNGKPDYQAIRALATPDVDPSPAAKSAPNAGDPVDIRALYAELLDRPDATEDSTFVSLGGDSLSYVEMSVRLEEALGHLPANWHTTPIRELRPAARKRPRGRALETSVLLRTVAIVLVVGSHAHLFTLLGSAHLLLAVAGFNFARFQLTPAERGERIRHQLRSIARIVVPSMAWIGAVCLLTRDYSVANVFLLNGFLGPATWTTEWHFWFVEILVYLLVGLAALLAIPWVDRLERRIPFGFPLVLLAAGLLTRFGLVDFGVPHMKPALWLFALGWAAARATASWQRILVTVVAVTAVPGFFDDPRREAVMIAGLTLLVWVTSIRVPVSISRAGSVLASASLFIYLTHWQVYPLVDNPALAVAASLGVGVLYWHVVTKVLGARVRRYVLPPWPR